MARWLRRIAKMALVGAATAIVTVWFRNRIPPEVDSPGPGSAAWPPLRPLPEPTDGAPAEPAAALTGSSPWVDPNHDGSCPPSHPVKAKQSSGIYHEPGGMVYERTKADRCYCTSDDAVADGFRASRM